MPNPASNLSTPRSPSGASSLTERSPCAPDDPTRRPEASFGEEYTAYQRDRSPLRRLIRTFYLDHAAHLCRGKVIDYGCGIGELLARLPDGSIGLEINPATVAFCQERGLPVHLEVNDAGRPTLNRATPGEFGTLIISHVLEHLNDPDETLRTLLKECAARSIDRLIVIVPGVRGYASDATHRTFIDEAYLRAHDLFPPAGWKLSSHRFPFNAAWVGKYFTHNELIVIYDRES